jgi:hypothetical protein
LASVPFDFIVGGHALPAGDYEFGVISDGGVLRVRSESGAQSVLTTSAPNRDSGARTAVLVEFHRYGNEYFLYKAWNGSADYGREIPASRMEREVTTRAPVSQPETVMVLARL